MAAAVAPALPGYFLARINLIWIAIIGAASLNLLMGNAGQVSLGQAAFMAIGAYTTVLVDRLTGWSLLATLPAGAMAAGLIGFLIGIPSLRFRGFYLALTTLALHFAVQFVGTQSQTLSGGLAGFDLPTPRLGTWTIKGDLSWFYLLGATALATLVVFYNLGRSKIGRAWAAVRDRDIAAAIIGVNVQRYKLLAFLISSFAAGAAGALQANYVGNVAVETYSLDLSISYVAMIIIGGLGSVAGSVLGAVVVTELPFFIQSASALLLGPDSGTSFGIFDLQAGAFGIVIMGFLMFEPDGLAGIARRALEQMAGRRVHHVHSTS
jgi:branched-chain amino acid transport system permease protein